MIFDSSSRSANVSDAPLLLDSRPFMNAIAGMYSLAKGVEDKMIYRVSR